MKENPYQPPQSEDRSYSGELKLKRIGFLTQVTGGCFLANLILLFWTASTSQRDPNVIMVVIEGIFTLVLWITSCASAGMLMNRINGPVMGLLYAFGAVIPCLNIVVLAVAMQKGTYYLRRHGLMFNLTSFKVYPMEAHSAGSSDSTAPQNQASAHVDRPAVAVSADRQVFEGNIPLNAEALAAGGIRRTYDSLLPTLQQFVESPELVTEQIDGYDNSYSVKCGGERYRVTGPDLDAEGNQAWERATSVLFDVVNRQLNDSETTFYAIGSGQDLAGLFLNNAEYAAARQSAADEKAEPYLPAKPTT